MSFQSLMLEEIKQGADVLGLVPANTDIPSGWFVFSRRVEGRARLLRIEFPALPVADLEVVADALEQANSIHTKWVRKRIVGIADHPWGGDRLSEISRKAIRFRGYQAHCEIELWEPLKREHCAQPPELVEVAQSTDLEGLPPKEAIAKLRLLLADKALNPTWAQNYRPLLNRF